MLSLIKGPLTLALTGLATRLTIVSSPFNTEIAMALIWALLRSDKCLKRG